MADFELVCGICQRQKGVDALCHHCSKPLCEEHRIPWRDKTFADNPLAIHCLDCLLQYHLRVGPVFEPLVRGLWVHSLTFRAYLRRSSSRDSSSTAKGDGETVDDSAQGDVDEQDEARTRRS